MSGGDGVNNPYDDTALLVLIAIIDALCDAILEDTVAIRAITDSEPILTEYNNEFTTDGTEQTVVTEETPAGILEPRCFILDMTNHTAGETIVVREYYRISDGGGMLLESVTTQAGVLPNSRKLLRVDMRPTRFGFRITVEKTGGANRDYDYELFYEEAP